MVIKSHEYKNSKNLHSNKISMQTITLKISLIRLLVKLFQHISCRRRYQFALLLCLTFGNSIGSGKSTVLDLPMALLELTQGRVSIDNKLISNRNLQNWQNTISHVPQSIYLADTTIAENIAFGIPPKQIDLDRVREAADQAHIPEFIESRLEGYGTFVGDVELV